MVSIVTHTEFEALANDVKEIKTELEIYKSIPFSIKFISRVQAALMLNKSVQTIGRMIKRNELGYIKGERSIDVSIDSVIDYMKKMHIKPSTIKDRIKMANNL